MIAQRIKTAAMAVLCVLGAAGYVLRVLAVLPQLIGVEPGGW